MSYEQFLEDVKTAIQEQLGDGYNVNLQKITKVNGVVLDGLIISETDKNLAPTIYLNPYYVSFEQGEPFPDILEAVISIYKEHRDVALGDMKRLLDFNNIKDLVVYKLIQKETNQELLEDIPSFEFLDMAVVFSLILDESKSGQMTALIHNSHLAAWGTTKEELYHLAMKNTPKLLPPVITTMKEIIGNILKEQFEGLCMDELPGDFLDTDPKNPSLYVLSNKMQLNGAGCILYDDCLKKFSAEQTADVIILPSSLHEVILIPDQGGLDYEELQKMVIQVNKNDVPDEDVLSNRVYKYSRQDCRISLVK
jgi:hypothetical protein